MEGNSIQKEGLCQLDKALCLLERPSMADKGPPSVFSGRWRALLKRPPFGPDGLFGPEGPKKAVVPERPRYCLGGGKRHVGPPFGRLGGMARMPPPATTSAFTWIYVFVSFFFKSEEGRKSETPSYSSRRDASKHGYAF